MAQFVNPGVIPIELMLKSVQWADRLAGLEEAIALFRNPSAINRMGVGRIYFPQERQQRWAGDLGYEAFCCLTRGSDGRWYLEYSADIPLDAVICLK